MTGKPRIFTVSYFLNLSLNVILSEICVLDGHRVSFIIAATACTPAQPAQPLLANFMSISHPQFACPNSWLNCFFSIPTFLGFLLTLACSPEAMIFANGGTWCMTHSYSTSTLAVLKPCVQGVDGLVIVLYKRTLSSSYG